jgi:L-fucose isomerase-like protein
MSKNKIKAAFIGFGEINTPKEIINKKLFEAKKVLEQLEIELITTEYVYDDIERKEANRAVKYLINKNFDFLIVCVAGWIPTYTIIDVLNEFSHKPMLLWGLSGYYEDGKLMSTADQAGTSAVRKIMEDLGYNYKFIYNTPNYPPMIDEIRIFSKVVKAINLLKHSRIGMMGFRDMKLYSTLYDGVSLKAKIGPEIEIFEMLEMVQKIKTLDKKDILEIVNKVKKEWIFENPIEEEVLTKGIELFLVLKQKIKEENYQAFSLIDVDGVKKLLRFSPSMALMLIADELNVCTIPENDTLGAVSQLIVKYLTGQIGAYMEIYEFMEKSILLGVPDYVPSEVIDGPIRVITSKFGYNEKGILYVPIVKTGEITLCRLASTGGNYSMHIITGKAVEPRDWREIGWEYDKQPASIEVIPNIPIKEFAEKVLSQHYIISYGDNSKLLKEFCKLLKISII